MARRSRTATAARITGNVPDYSPCCRKPVLPMPGALYCNGCQLTLLDLDGDRRPAALGELRWEKLYDGLYLMWRNLRVAYARDFPHYSGDLRRVEKVTYLWVVGCSDADFSRIATALRLHPQGMDYPGRRDFPSLEAAAEDLWRCLAGQEKVGAIPHWSAAKTRLIAATGG
jgi:hypothetical protein